MATDRLRNLAALTAILSLPGCTMTMADAYGSDSYGSYAPPPYAPIDTADDYAWIDRADALWEAIGDAPPDYAFAFEGAEPWVWETASGYQIVVEDAGVGGIRSYYFAPGDPSPFLAVEPGSSFGYAGGTVAMIYGPDGGALPRGQWGGHMGRAMQLYARARLLKRAMTARDRRGVDADAWNDASGMILNFALQFDSGQRRHPGWRAHRGSAEAQAWRHRLETERQRRRGEAGQFERWRHGGFQGPPPEGFAPHRRGGPRNGRPPQPGQPQPGVGHPERPDIGAVSPRPRPDMGPGRPMPVRVGRGPRDKFPEEAPNVDDAMPPTRMEALRPDRPERPRPAHVEAPPRAPVAVEPVRAPPAPPPPPPHVAVPTPSPPTAAPPPRPMTPRERSGKFDPEEVPN